MTPTDDKPFAPACERNKQSILEQLMRWIERPASVLEIGSGTGQHAVHFATQLGDLTWWPSDRADHLEGINRWVAEANLPNLKLAQELDVMQATWPTLRPDHVFSANTAHIMPWTGVKAMLDNVATLLPLNGLFLLYGPFNADGQFTSEGNRQLDAWAREAFAGAGLRDQRDVVNQATKLGLKLREDVAMPANNRLLVFTRMAR